MSDFRKLSEMMLASPQLTAEDVARAKAEGVTLIINNRPDNEETDQPSGDEIAEAAKVHGIDYVEIPVSSAGFSLPQVEAMREALDKAEGKTLAFCRSGTRSTFLWSMAQALKGADLEGIAEQAAGAGYDISPVRPTMVMLANQSQN